MTARSPGLALLAHALAVLTVVGVGMQILLVPDALATLFPWGLSIFLFTATALAVGWLIAWKRPGMALGWIVLAIAFLFGLQGLTLGLGDALQTAVPGPASWLLSFGAADSQYSWLPPIGLLFTQVPLRFPTGALPSRRWAWFSRFTIAVLALSTALIATAGRNIPGLTVANPFYVDWGAAGDLVSALALLVLLPAFVGSIASLFVRHRRADAVQRAQLRWVFWAVATVVGLLVSSWIEGAIFGDENAPGLPGFVSNAWQFVTGLGYSLIPLAILFAVLRYGLYSIDRIISRTASYAIVTISVVVLYGAIVVVASLLPGLKSFGVALATLVAAAVFLPLLRAVRRVVDRRFNREQYDAQRVVEAFGERVRNGADPYRAGRDLVAAVEQTLHPGGIGVWMPDRSR